jgi:hypothetical protein
MEDLANFRGQATFLGGMCQLGDLGTASSMRYWLDVCDALRDLGQT